MKNFISGELTVKDLKELLEGVPDDFKLEVSEEYYESPKVHICINKREKKINFSQGV